MTIRKTQLWKSLSPCVRRKDWPVLERELQRVIDATKDQWGWLPNTPQLSRAFAWKHSPQGDAFWRELSNRLRDAGYEDVA